MVQFLTAEGIGLVENSPTLASCSKEAVEGDRDPGYGTLNVEFRDGFTKFIYRWRKCLSCVMII